MKKFYFLFSIALFLFADTFGQVSGDFRSKTAGTNNWNDFNTWQVYNGSAWVNATTGQIPGSTSSVTIIAGDNRIINTSATAKNLTVNGNMIIKGFTLTLYGNLINSGIINGDSISGSTLAMNGINQQTISGSGTFVHNNIHSISIYNISGQVPSVNLMLNLGVSNNLTLIYGTLGTSNGSTFTIGRAASSISIDIVRYNGSLSLTPVINMSGVTLSNVYYNAPIAPTSITTGAELPAGIPITNLWIENPDGTILDKAVSCGTLYLFAGTLTTSSTNLITVTGTAASSIVSGGATNYVNGPLARVIPSGLSGSSNDYRFPVGKASYNPFEFSNINTTGIGDATIIAEVFDTGPYAATFGLGLGSIDLNKYWQLTGVMGAVNISSSQIKVSDASITASNKLSQSNILNGTYNTLGSDFTTGSITSIKAIDYSNISTGTLFRIGTQGSSGGSFPAGKYAIGPNGPYAGYLATYPTFQSAIDALADIPVAGNVVFEFQSDYAPSVETYPISFTPHETGNSTGTVVFRPASTVSLAINFTNAGTVLTMNGCNYISLDGRNGGTGTNKYLQFTNSSTSAQTMDISNDATYNQIRYCVLKGASTSTSTGILQLSPGTTKGNDHTIINHCNFDGGGTAAYCLYATGNANAINDSIIVSNNNFFDFRASTAAGIYASNYNNTWTIDSNNFYQTSAYSGLSGTTYCIYLSLGGASGQFNIYNNYLGGNAPGCSGMWTVNATNPAAYNYTGIYLNLSTATNRIYNNVIKNFDWKCLPSTWTGINLAGGNANIGTDGANQIGSITGNDSIKVTYYTNSGTANVYGITTGGGGSLRIENNKIGAITTILDGSITSVGTSITGINASGVNCIVRNNIIGSTVTASSIKAGNQSSGGYTQNVTGILAAASYSNAINNNTIANLYNGLTVVSTSSGLIRGIKISSGTIIVADSNHIYTLSTPQAMWGKAENANIAGIDIQAASATNTTLTGNTIYDLVNTSLTGGVIINGIFASLSSSAFNKIEKNLIHSFRTASDTAVQTGFQLNSGICSFQNNVIRLGIDKNGLSVTSTAQINGINKVSTSAGNCKFYFNTIYIGGSGVATGLDKTYGFYLATHTSEDIRNNIIVNVRTKTIASQVNYAISYSGTLNSNFTSDYNIYSVSASNGKLGIVNAADELTMAALKASLPVNELHSGMGNPLLALPANAAASMNLSITSTSPAEGTGIAISGINDDFAGTIRSSNTPTDIGAYAGNFTVATAGQDIFGPVITYAPLTNSAITSTRVLTGFATITDQISGVNTTISTKPRLYYKKSTDNNAFGANTSAFNGWKFIEASNSSSPYNFSINYSILNGGSVAVGIVIQYYVVAQDLATTPNVIFNPLAGSAGTSVATTGMTAPTLPNSYTTVTAIPTTISVGIGQTFTTLTGASASNSVFAAINAGALSGNTTVTVVSDIVEPGITALNAISHEEAGGYTLTIKPDATARTLSGSTTTSSNPLIDFNGPSNVIIDGGPGKLLTIRNTNVTPSSTGPVVRFYNGSVADTIKSCIIESNESSLSSAGILIGAVPANNIIISGCDIRDARTDNIGNPAVGIYSNSIGNILQCFNNNIYNWTSYGIYVNGAPGDSCVIAGNSFYMESGSLGNQTSIYLNGGNRHNISGNFVGGTTANCGGVPLNCGGSLTPFSVHVGIIANSYIQGNTVTNIILGGALTGFAMDGMFNCIGNTVGHLTTTNAIQLSSAGGHYGFYVNSASASNNFEQNVIANITITAASGGAGFTAMRMDNGNARKNKIFNIGTAAVLSSASIYGIFDYGGSAAKEYSNNMISLSAGATTNAFIAGYIEWSSASSMNFSYNSINIYGTASGSQYTYAFLGAYIPTILKDNILVNTRTGGTGFNYALYNAGNNALISDYNDLYVAGNSSSFIGEYLGDFGTLVSWQASSLSPDQHSISALPAFISNSDLHIVNDLNIANHGAAIFITDDIDGYLRCPYPDMGINQFSACNSPLKALTLKVILEALYNSGGIMNQAQGISGNEFTGNTADQITVELHNSINYNTIIASFPNINLNTSGGALISVPITDYGSYYITIRHRNSIETVSAAPISFLGSVIFYDFSFAPTQAYGSNLKLLENGIYGIYAGDVNHDGAVDVNDLFVVQNDAILFSTGYLLTDVNGDGTIDANDIILIQNNTTLFVSEITP